MKRIIKAPDIRKNEIIQIAKKLFETNGYEKTSVEAIIQSAGIAKGTFYHYFKSKKDMLNALVELITQDIEAHFKSIIELKELSSIDKLKMMLIGPEKQVKIELSVMEVLHHPSNRELQEELNIKTIQRIAPLISTVIELGNDEGVFHVTQPLETIQFILAGSALILESGLFQWSPKKQNKLRGALQNLAESALGAIPGSLSFISTP